MVQMLADNSCLLVLFDLDKFLIEVLVIKKFYLWKYWAQLDLVLLMQSFSEELEGGQHLHSVIVADKKDFDIGTVKMEYDPLCFFGISQVSQVSTHYIGMQPSNHFPYWVFSQRSYRE